MLLDSVKRSRLSRVLLVLTAIEAVDNFYPQHSRVVLESESRMIYFRAYVSRDVAFIAGFAAQKSSEWKSSKFWSHKFS